MKFDLKQTFKNFYYVLSSNLLALVISVLVVIVVPKVIGIREYGYWQLFTFYASYFGILSLGWWDGIYLEYGGKKFEDLSVASTRSLKIQFFQICTIGIMIAIIIFLYGKMFESFDEKIIFLFLAINFPLYIVQNFLRSIFQATNILKKYASSLMISNIIYIGGILLSICINVVDYQWILVSYSIGNVVSSLLLLNSSQSILFHKGIKFREYFDFKDSFKNIRSGFSILVANLAGMLIVGVIRMGVKSGWSVSTFGKISLTLSISNFAMVFIGAIGLVAYPVLRNISKNQIENYYPKIHALLMLSLFAMMFIYFPLRIVLPIWLPKYQDSLTYMAVLFPVLVYQGKFELLTNVLYKVFRYEKKLFIVNAITVLFSLIFTVITVYFIHNLSLTILSLILVFQIRSALGEIMLEMLNFKTMVKDISIEIMIVSIFVASTWYLNIVMALFIYGLTITIFCFFSYHNIRDSIGLLRHADE